MRLHRSIPALILSATLLLTQPAAATHVLPKSPSHATPPPYSGYRLQDRPSRQQAAQAQHYLSILRLATYVQAREQAAAAQRAEALRVQQAQVAQQEAAGLPAAKWIRLAACESSGNWHDTAGHFEGGLQFLHSTWLAYGGAQYAYHAYDASPTQQATVAQRLLSAAGVMQWPVCGPRTGLS